jgi:hypothetical protein
MPPFALNFSCVEICGGGKRGCEEGKILAAGRKQREPKLEARVTTIE